MWRWSEWACSVCTDIGCQLSVPSASNTNTPRSSDNTHTWGDTYNVVWLRAHRRRRSQGAKTLYGTFPFFALPSGLLVEICCAAISGTGSTNYRTFTVDRATWHGTWIVCSAFYFLKSSSEHPEVADLKTVNKKLLCVFFFFFLSVFLCGCVSTSA